MRRESNVVSSISDKLMKKHRKFLRELLVFVAGCVCIQNVSASNWSSSNIQLLHGSGYELGEDERTILTFEHANAWRYGDNFFFVDVTEPSGTGTSHYAEFSPRLSLSKLTGRSFSAGVIKDVLIAGTLEMGDNLHAHLLGIGLSLDLAKFKFLNINLYARKSYRDVVEVDTDLGGQLTVNWLLPFTLKNSKWVFEGFFDYAFGENGGTSPKSDSLLAQPRLLLDIGNFWNESEHVYAGIEYQAWRNKFGVDGVDEDVVQIMLKWIF
jgi:nucleoside-specific outer membrane channel protein Tsx